MLIQHAGINVLTDPMFSERASPVSFAGPSRVAAPGLSLETLPPIDLVIISHDHFDHLDRRSIRWLGNGPRYFVSLGLKDWLVDAGIDPARVIELDWFDLAIIPIGSYAPRAYMRNFHLDPEQAVQDHRDVHARQSMAIHWGTFDLTAEHLLEPPKLLDDALRAAGIAPAAFTPFAFGESRSNLPVAGTQ